jgi:hypothetical protein
MGKIRGLKEGGPIREVLDEFHMGFSVGRVETWTGEDGTTNKRMIIEGDDVFPDLPGFHVEIHSIDEHDVFDRLIIPGARVMVHIERVVDGSPPVVMDMIREARARGEIEGGPEE